MVDMTEPGLLVSVIIPTHNRWALLSRLLESLARQTLDSARYEVIIVHNHTPDGTEKMAREWCGRQPFRALYFRKNYKGPTRSRDFGASIAEGRYLAFIDDDCVATPGWLEAGIAGFDAGDHVGLVQGRTLPMPEQLQSFPCKTVRIEAPSVFYETCNIFYYKTAYEAVGGFSEDFLDKFYGEDTDLGWKVTRKGYSAVFAQQALVHHEVFHVTLYKWLAEPLFFKNLPYLVKKHPALRQHMFLGFFLTKDTCLYNLFLVALVVSPFSPAAGLVLALPYFIERYRNGNHVGGFANRMARIIMGIPRGLFIWWALVKGSIRARSLLL